MKVSLTPLATRFANWLGANEENGQEKSLLARQVLVAFGPLLLTVGSGLTTGYSAILLPQLLHGNNTFKTEPEEASWIASMAALPMALGCLLGGLSLDQFGRKTTHLITILPNTIGWLLISFALNVNMILIGRFITGLCMGFLGSATSVYLAETSAPKYRGILLGAISFSISAGLFLSHLIGTFVNWKLTALICILPQIVSCCTLIFMPESPSFLAKKQRIEEARKAFIWTRGSGEEATKEFEEIVSRNTVKMEEIYWKNRILVPEFFKPLGIILVFIIANQWAGINAITFYTVSIMKSTIGEGVNEYLAMLIIDFVRLVMSIVACVLLRKTGRRPLSIISGTGTTLALLVLSTFTFFVKFSPNLVDYPFVPLTALIAYISFITIGFVPLPWAMIGEVFPLASRNIGSGFSTMMAFLAFFSVVKTSPSMFNSLGAEGTFLVYALVALLGTVFVWIFLPETKGKALHEIEDYFKGNCTKKGCT